MKPAIVAVGYSRPADLLRLLISIENAFYETNNIPLVISLDKASNESEVIKVAEEFQWSHGEKIIRTFPIRQGLRKHVIQCGDLSEKYGAVIILEDDLIVSPNFYTYTQKALDFYHDNPEITGISLYSHEWNGYARRNFQPMADGFDVYWGQYGISWGQCWTKEWWSRFKSWYELHEDRLNYNPRIPRVINHWSNQSWGKYFNNFIVEKNLFYIIPRLSLTTNCSDVGQHVKIPDNVYQVRLLCSKKEYYAFPKSEEAIRYDMFFENMKLSNEFREESANGGICINLNGIERTEIKERFLLTTQDLPYKVIKSYGLMMRPYEMNIYFNIPGNVIRLYDTKTSESVRLNERFNVFRYEIRGFSVKDIWSYFLPLLKRSISHKLHKK